MKALASTKVIATLGPASSAPEVIRELVGVGVDVFRLNCSHSSHADLERMVLLVREVEKDLQTPLGIMGDLCGPKIRVGLLPDGGYPLTPGAEVILASSTTKRPGTAIPITYSQLAADVEVGQPILLNDGLFELRVVDIEGRHVRCEVISGGLLTSNKGVNLPHAKVSAPALSTKDKADAEFLLERGVDILALSFVRTAANVRSLRNFMKRHGAEAILISKIEKPQALDDLDGILQASDGIMVARGDLGVEVEPQKVPILQKHLIQAANHHGKIVITATQMLESMIENPRPTRAEATDVANAVFDGTDAVMLSGETAVGKFPAASAQIMHQILHEAEGSPFFDRHRIGRRATQAHDVSSAVAHAAVRAAEECQAQAIAVFSYSGHTTRLIAKLRPPCAIVGLTPNEKVARIHSMAWGVTSVLTEPQSSLDEMLAAGKRILIDHPMAGRGKRVIMVSGANFDDADNLIQIVELGK